jgi:L-cystine uptake protein TcyP (sodium:dicarboxylate symporter family)
LAVPLNLIWEVAQIRAYEFPETTLMTDVIGCFLPTLGDGLLMLIIFWTGWAVFRDSQWILKPALNGYVLMFVIGIFLAIIVELNALYLTGAWRYSEQMITIPVLGVGLLPLLQMVLLPPITAVLLRWIWTKTETIKLIKVSHEERR